MTNLVVDQVERGQAPAVPHLRRGLAPYTATGTLSAINVSHQAAGTAGYQCYREAPRVPQTPPVGPRPDVRRACEQAVWRGIEQATARLQAREPGLTPAQAIDRALAADP